jgi:DNA-binding SARP family transcriptional activator
MQFRLLGPLEVVDGDRSLALGGRKQRSLFAMLLLHANDVLSTELLVDEVWGPKLREALGLWRGPPLADLAYEPFARSHVARLEDLRFTALEQRIEADLASGKHARLTGELEALVAQHPLRERLHGQLMLALYRSGRQAEARAR